MTNEVKNVPELRFPEFDEKWDINIFGDVVTNKSSKYTPKKTENLIDIELDSIESNTGRLIKKYTSNDFSSQKNVFKHHQVLYSKLRPYLNKYYFPNFDGVCTSEIWILDSKYSSTLSNEFLYYFIQTNKFKEVTNKSSGSKMPRADWNLVENMRFNITSLKEQQKISGFFSKLDRQIELEEQKLEKLEEQKKGYMQKIFSQELRFKDENGNDYPDWKSSKIENQLKERNERSGEGQMLSVTINSGIVKFNELDRKDNSSKDKSNYKVVKKGDIAYNSMRMWQGASGKSDYDGIVSPAYTVIYPTQSTSSAFIEYKFKTYRMIHTFKINSQGLTSDTWNLKYKQLKNINIDMPVLKEQEKIGSFFKKIDQLINKQKEKVEVLQKNKNGFLQKMFV